MKILIALSNKLDITDAEYHKLIKAKHDAHKNNMDTDNDQDLDYSQIVQRKQASRQQENQEKHFKHKRMLKRAKNTHTAVYKQ